MALPNMSQMNQNLQGVVKNAHTASEQMENLNKSVFSYGKALLTLGAGAAAKQAFVWLVEQSKAQKDLIVSGRERLLQGKGALSSMQDELKHMTKAAGFNNNQRKQQREAIEQQKFFNKGLEEELTFREGVSAIVEKRPVLYKVEIGAVTLISALYAKMLESSHALNQALLKTNTSTEIRFALISKILTVQQELGASTETAAEATRALVEYGANLNAGFQGNLKAVIMMRDGLGIAASTGAELVTIFSRQLHVAAESVGDAIADVASQTGLAAERAAQFAIELARALRVLGPGFRSEAAGVTKVIAGLAGRVQELGGNAQTVVNVFKRMSGGTSEAFFMRGLAGTSVGQMGTGAGSEEAMKGLSKRISSILTAPEGTPMYVAQLEAVAEMTGMAANEIVDFQEAIKDMNKPLSESQSLAKAYRDQTALVGASWKQMKDALLALTTEALLPLVKFIQPVVKGMADFVKWLSGAKGLVWVLTGFIPVAGIVCVGALVNVGRQLLILAAQSQFVQGVLGRGASMTVLKDLSKMGTLAAFRGGNAFGNGFASFGAAGFAGSIAAILGAGAVGAAIGTWLDRRHPDNFLSKIARTLSTWYVEDKQRYGATSARDTRIGGHGAVYYADKAAKDLAEYAQGHIKKEQLDKSVNAAILAGTHNGSSEAVVKRYIANIGKQVLEDKFAVGHLTRTTTKTDKDREQDAKEAAALQLVNEKQLEAQRDVVETLERSHQQSLKLLQDQQSSMIWNMPNSGTHRISYDLTPNQW